MIKSSQGINSNSYSNNSYTEEIRLLNLEEELLKNKLKDSKSKKTIKGLTSLAINRQHSKMIVNSISNSIYLYDPLFFDAYPPAELKGHKSSFYVKSVLSPDCNFVLSGSSDASIYIWDIKNTQKLMRSNPLNEFVENNPIALIGYHGLEVSHNNY